MAKLLGIINVGILLDKNEQIKVKKFNNTLNVQECDAIPPWAGLNRIT
jgi:hypothetical protein